MAQPALSGFIDYAFVAAMIAGFVLHERLTLRTQGKLTIT